MEREEPLSAREVEEMARQHATGEGWSDANRGWGSAAVGRDKFPVLTAMATSLRIVGWLMVAGAAVLFFVQVMPWLACLTEIEMKQPQQPGMFNSPSCGVAVLILAPMIVSLVGGFCMVAFGEVIGIFRGIEGNTYQLLSRVEQAGFQSKLAGEERQS